MEPVFKCDYCGFMGDAKTVEVHEVSCIYNLENKTCETCKYSIQRQFGGHYCKFNYAGVDDGKLIGQKPQVNCKNWEEGKPIRIIPV